MRVNVDVCCYQRSDVQRNSEHSGGEEQRKTGSDDPHICLRRDSRTGTSKLDRGSRQRVYRELLSDVVQEVYIFTHFSS
jgi:hypothetical protein